MSRLTANEIVKIYGKNEVLHKVNLTLESGKIYGLIGRNGAGKTTLLSVLTAQNPVNSGTVILDGQPVWENSGGAEETVFFQRTESDERK